MAEEKKFGQEHRFIGEGLLTLEKAAEEEGADLKEIWTKITHDRDMARRVIRLVVGEKDNIAIFTKQQREAMGRVIKDVLDNRPLGVSQAVDGALLIHNFCTLLEEDDPQFDRNEFFASCGLKQPKS